MKKIFKNNHIHNIPVKLNTKGLTIKLPKSALNHLNIKKEQQEVFLTIVANVLQITSKPCLTIPALEIDENKFQKQP